MLFFKYFFFLQVALWGTFLIGYLVIGSGPENKRFFNLFLNLVIGSVLISLITSLIYTKGKTINTGFLILFAIIFFQRKALGITWRIPEFSSKEVKDQMVNLGLISFIGSLIFLIKFSFIYSVDGVPIPPHPDYAFYSKLSHFLSTFGKETKQLDFIYPETTPYLPYHYFELWINVAYNKILNASDLFTLLLVTSSIGVVMVWVGFCAIYETLRKVGWKEYFICFILLFFSGLTISTSSENWLTRDVEGFFVNVFSFPKLQFVFIFIILFFIFSLNRKPLWAYYSLLALPVVYFTTVLGILGAFGAFSLFSLVFFRDKQVMMKKVFFASLLLGVYLFCFYFFLNIDKGNLGKAGYTFLGISAYLKTSFNVFVGSVLRFFYIYLFIFLILFFFLQRKFKNELIKTDYFIISVLVFIFSLLSWAVLHPLIDSVQFFTNLGLPFINVLFIYLLFLSLSTANQIKSRLISALLIMGFFGNFYFFIKRTFTYRLSSEYVLAASEKIKNLNHLGVFLKHRREYENPLTFYSSVATLGEYLTMYYPDQHTISLSDFEGAYVKDTKEIDFSLLDKQGSFYKYVENQKKHGVFKNYDQSKIDFIRRFKIDYLYASNEVALPREIKEIVKDSIFDSVSGERLYILK